MASNSAAGRDYLSGDRLVTTANEAVTCGLPVEVERTLHALRGVCRAVQPPGVACPHFGGVASSAVTMPLLRPGRTGSIEPVSPYYIASHAKSERVHVERNLLMGLTERQSSR